LTEKVERNRHDWEAQLGSYDRDELTLLREEVQDAANAATEAAREFDNANAALIRFVRLHRGTP